MSGNDEESDATREKRLRRAVASVAGFELRKGEAFGCHMGAGVRPLSGLVPNAIN